MIEDTSSPTPAEPEKDKLAPATNQEQTAEFENTLETDPEIEQEQGQPLQQAFRQNFTLSPDPKHAYTTTGMTGWDPAAASTVYPSATSANMNRGLISADNNVNPEEDDQAAAYAQAVSFSTLMMPKDGALERVAQRGDADYVQHVEVNGRPLPAGVPRLKAPEAGQQMTPEASRNYFRSRMKLGTVFQLPLWHSGFWITLKAPSEGDLLELLANINSEKVAIGRQTYGRLLSATTAYTAGHLMNFVTRHLYSTSLDVADMEELRKHILLPDLPLLYWGLACAMYPTGFQYERACTAEPLKCRHRVQEKINLSRLLFTDKSRLTEKQRLHMTKTARASMSVEQVQAYRDDFTIGKNKDVPIGDVTFELTIPTIEEYLLSAVRWVTSIEETYGLSMELNEKERTAFLHSQHQATAMREYAHCVKSIVVDDDLREDRKTVVENLLNDFSTIEDVRDNFIAKVTEFIEDATFSLVAIPTYNCPSCGKPQRRTKEGDPFEELIALEPSQTFFHLAYQRRAQIQHRDLKAN